MNLTLTKYLVPLLTVLSLVLGALQVALADGLTLKEGLQVAALLVGAFVTYIVRLLESGWAAGLKVAGAVIGGLLVAVIEFIDSGLAWDAAAVIFIVLAGVNILIAQLGSDARIDAAADLVLDPHASTEAILAVDESAVKAASEQIDHAISLNAGR